MFLNDTVAFQTRDDVREALLKPLWQDRDGVQGFILVARGRVVPFEAVAETLTDTVMRWRILTIGSLVKRGTQIEYRFTDAADREEILGLIGEALTTYRSFFGGDREVTEIRFPEVPA